MGNIKYNTNINIYPPKIKCLVKWHEFMVVLWILCNIQKFKKMYYFVLLFIISKIFSINDILVISLSQYNLNNLNLNYKLW